MGKQCFMCRGFIFLLCAPCGKKKKTQNRSVLCMTLWLCVNCSGITKGELLSKKRVKRHTVEITLMGYSWSALFHYVVALLIFSSSLAETKAVWFALTDFDLQSGIHPPPPPSFYPFIYAYSIYVVFHRAQKVWQTIFFFVVVVFLYVLVYMYGWRSCIVTCSR